MIKEKEIRAVYDDETITVYQAYRPAIAQPAVRLQKFVPPFKLTRMSWIKPSFLWMMYRSGWAKKEGQEHVLSIKIKREGWEWALRNSCLSHFVEGIHPSYEDWKTVIPNFPVRIQWDPEKDIHLQKQEYKSIQVGLSGVAIEKYAKEWVVAIDDISEKCRAMHQLIAKGQTTEAAEMLPKERVYPIPEDIKKIIYAS